MAIGLYGQIYAGEDFSLQGGFVGAGASEFSLSIGANHVTMVCKAGQVWYRVIYMYKWFETTV
jgi:hypothetical protein